LVLNLEKMCEEIKLEFQTDCEYGAQYCYDIIHWNMRHLSSNIVTIDNITCFQTISERVYGSASIFYNVSKNELLFRCNIMENFVYTEI
jgi:hypothetical protein